MNTPSQCEQRLQKERFLDAYQHRCPVRHECLPTALHLSCEELERILEFSRAHGGDDVTVQFCKSGLSDEYPAPGIYAWLLEDFEQEGPVLHVNPDAVYPTDP